MARGESRKRKPGTPDYRKRFWAAVTAIVVAAGSIGVSHAGFTLPNQAQKQVQMAAAETEPAERTAKKQVPNAAKRSLELEDAQGIQEADAAAVADQSELESDKTTASPASRVSMRQCMRLRTCSTCVRAVERSMRL